MGRPRKNPVESGYMMLVATESFSVRRDGADVSFEADKTRIAANHPWLRGIEHLFAPAGPSRGFEYVEQATAAPGELRGEAA